MEEAKPQMTVASKEERERQDQYFIYFLFSCWGAFTFSLKVKATIPTFCHLNKQNDIQYNICHVRNTTPFSKNNGHLCDYGRLPAFSLSACLLLFDTHAYHLSYCIYPPSLPQRYTLHQQYVVSWIWRLLPQSRCCSVRNFRKTRIPFVQVTTSLGRALEWKSFLLVDPNTVSVESI